MPVAAIAVLTSACASSTSSAPPSQPQPSGVNAATIGKEYQRETTVLRLPPGGKFPPKSYSTMNTYQPGFGKNDADLYWLCAWEHQYLTGTGAQRTAAAQQISTITSKYVYLHSYNAYTRQQTDQQLAAMHHGDPRPIQHDFQLNCT